MPATRIAADLSFSVLAGTGRSAQGRLHGTRSDLRLDVDDPSVFAGSADAPAVRDLAEELDLRGVRVRVFSDGRHLVSIGHVSAPWWQRRLTGSRRIRLGSLRGAWTSARARARSLGPVLPDAGLLPPPTLSPLLPTFGGRRRRPTTTHDPDRGGSPRLVLTKSEVWAGERLPVYWLGEETTIGSEPGCDVVLPGLEPRHAVVRHDDEDELVIEPLDGDVRVHGARVGTRQVLRTGARVEVGAHRLAYYREEHADHGRPYGGRMGGEIGRQRWQPPPAR